MISTPSLRVDRLIVTVSTVSEVTRILNSDDPQAAEELLPVIYQELRKLAAAKMSKLPPGQTIQPTGLVHEAWLRLSKDTDAKWDNRGHFFHAASEAMRRIIVERLRRKKASKRDHVRADDEFDEAQFSVSAPAEEILAVHDALDRLEAQNNRAAQLVKLRYFTGFTMAEAAEILDLPLRSAERLWSFAKSWLHREVFPER